MNQENIKKISKIVKSLSRDFGNIDAEELSPLASVMEEIYIYPMIMKEDILGLL